MEQIKKAITFLITNLTKLNAWIHKILGIVNSKEFELIRLIYADTFTQLTRNAKLTNFEIVRLTQELDALKQIIYPKENQDGKATVTPADPNTATEGQKPGEATGTQER